MRSRNEHCRRGILSGELKESDKKEARLPLELVVKLALWIISGPVRAQH